MKTALKTFFMVILSSLSIVGAIVGVGFVSGREIVSFFFDYGEIALVLCLFSFAIECVCLYVNLKPAGGIGDDFKRDGGLGKNCKIKAKCVKIQPENIDFGNINARTSTYGEKINNAAMRFEKNEDDGFLRFYNAALGLFELLSSAAMIAGIFELMGGVKSISFSAVVVFKIVALLFVYIFAFLSPGTITKISGYTSLVLFLMMTVNIVINFSLLSSSDTIYFSFLSSNVFGGLFSCVFYVSMNMLSCAGVFRDLKRKCATKKMAITISVVSAFLLHILIFLCLSLYFSNPDITCFSMPLVLLSLNAGKLFYFIYYICLLLCSLVSLTCVCYSGHHYLHGLVKLDKRNLGVLYLLCGYLISLFGFNFLVSKIYPFVGMGYIVLVLVKKVFYVCKKRKI